MAPQSGVPSASSGGQCGRKMSEHCCRMCSTTWFWNTMVMDILVSSVSGRSSVGPNTMATLCTDMRFSSPRSITLQRGWGGMESGHRAWGGWGDPSRVRLPIPAACSLTGTGAGRAAAGCRGWGRVVNAPGPAHSGCAGRGPAALGSEGERGSARRGQPRGSWTRRCPRQASRTPTPSAPSRQALTDGRDKLAEVREGEEGLRQLSKEELQGASDNVDVFPAPVIQVETLI